MERVRQDPVVSKKGYFAPPDTIYPAVRTHIDVSPGGTVSFFVWLPR